MKKVTILDYQPRYAADFKRLNIEWIEKYFTVEAHDVEQLDHPEEYIISPGGYILLAQYGEDIVAACAIVKTGEQEYELAKMGVTPELRGQQIGKKIGQAVIEKAKAIGAKRVWLESNRKLTNAIHLYTRLGFIEVPVTVTPYARADIRMEMWL